MFKLLATLVLTLSLFSPAHALVEHADGSVTFNKAELEQLNARVNMLLQQAYQAGAEKALDVLKSNPKLCPKDV